MGMFGCYDAHFYCDCCNQFAQVAQVETYEEAIEAAQRGKGGWLFRTDGVILCDTCKDIKNPALIPKDGREGYEWNFRTQVERQYRNPKEIVDQTHELAEAFYKKHGYLHDRAKHGNLYESTHPQERLMWELACMAQIELTDTDPMDAMSELDEE